MITDLVRCHCGSYVQQRYYRKHRADLCRATHPEKRAEPIRWYRDRLAAGSDITIDGVRWVLAGRKWVAP